MARTSHFQTPPLESCGRPCKSLGPPFFLFHWEIHFRTSTTNIYRPFLGPLLWYFAVPVKRSTNQIIFLPFQGSPYWAGPERTLMGTTHIFWPFSPFQTIEVPYNTCNSLIPPPPQRRLSLRCAGHNVRLPAVPEAGAGTARAGD